VTFGSGATDLQVRTGTIGPYIGHSQLRNLADADAAACGKAEQDQVQAALWHRTGSVWEYPYLRGEQASRGTAYPYVEVTDARQAPMNIAHLICGTDGHHRD
jgi:hypothetical protein